MSVSLSVILDTLARSFSKPLARTGKGPKAIAVLCALNVIFWGIYEQQGNTMQLWADRNTNWNFAGIQIPSTWFQAFNPAMIFLFAPLLNIVWAWQARRRSASGAHLRDECQHANGARRTRELHRDEEDGNAGDEKSWKEARPRPPPAASR